MAPPFWILVLLVGAACGQDHVPTPEWRQKPPDQKPLVRSSRENSIVSQCDFEDDTKPLCDWSQMPTDDGDWIRTTGHSSTNSTSGPPGGYPNGEGYFLHMDSNTFRRGGVARLSSPELWEQGPFCVHFAYHMFGLSSGAQLRLLLMGAQNKRPNVLWKHVNTQSPSWMPTAVTVPADLTLPSRLMFEGVRGNTPYLDISLDALSIRRGTCNRICMTQMCSFDTLNDLCGWSWVPTATGAKWTQKKGPSGQWGVGPDDDYSSPGSGLYMLLDPKNAKPGQKSLLLSPLSQSSGCLTLSFHYILRAQSPGAALLVYTSFLGSIRKHTVYSGQPGPSWQPVSVNYTGQGQIQFIMMGVFGKAPEPAVAVDEISIAPCGESFPQCDFEDSAHPFCDWTHTSWDGGQWTWGSNNMPISITSHSREFLHGGEHYIYFDSDKVSKIGQSARLMSRPFCAPGDICVEFAYHMYGLENGTKLQLLLGSPVGSSPISLWSRVGPQSPDWLNSSVTIPSGHQQPMQLFLEATRGTNTAFVVAVSFIMINHGTCREKPVVSTEKPVVSTEKPVVSTEKPVVSTEKPPVPTEKPLLPTEMPPVPTEKPLVPTEKLPVPTEKLPVPTEKPPVPTEKPPVPTEKPVIPTEEPVVSTEKPPVPTENPVVTTEKPPVPTESPVVSTEKPVISTEKPPVPTEKPVIPTEKPSVPTEEPVVPTEEPVVPTEEPVVSTEKQVVSTEKPTMPTEETTVPTEEPTVPTEEPTVPTEEPTVPTEEPTVPTEETTVSTEEPAVPTEKTTVTSEETTVTQKPTPCTSCSRPVLSSMPPTVLVKTSQAQSTPISSVTPTTMTTPRHTTVSCPLNAHHESCACPETCENPKPDCGSVCKPGCVCNPGFLFSQKQCINASSCDCFDSKNYYKPGEEWFSPNCTKHCRCLPGSQMECQISQCGTHTMCQLKNGQYGCQPYGTATCLVYGSLHYVTFDERHIDFTGRCTYILTQTYSNSTDPFFRITAKNQKLGPEGMSCLNKVSIKLSKITITLLKGRRTLVGDKRVTLPIMPSEGVFLGPSGRFVQLSTTFGLRVRWDGDQQLFVTVSRAHSSLSLCHSTSVDRDCPPSFSIHDTLPSWPYSTYSGKLSGFCGNYDGDSSNDNLKPDGSPALDEETLGNSWQTAEEENKECQNEESAPSCDSALERSVSGLKYCGQLVDSQGIFEACLFHLKASFFFNNCVADLCHVQGLQLMLCTHVSAMTATCQDAGYAVRPWRRPQFCSLACPPNSQYSLCSTPCPDTCHSGFADKNCSDQCVEACECNPGFILSGFECVPRSQCGCLSPSGRYFKTQEHWYKPGCKELCICEGNNRVACQPWQCRAQEACAWKNGIYGCHAQDTATCMVSGDPHYLTFDGALHHFKGTCTYVLTQPCTSRSHENYFIVSSTNENRGGNLETSYVKAVHVQVFNLKISLTKGRKVMVNGHRVTLPVWPLQGRVTIRPSGSFVLLYTEFGLQVRYDGNHLVEVTVPSSYAGGLCGLCGNYNNSLHEDDILDPNKKPASSSSQLATTWKIAEASEPSCFLAGGKTSSCDENTMEDLWDKNCEILTNPVGPFSSCHQVVSPKASFTSCVHDQCSTKGDVLALCRSLQAYAFLCSLAGQMTNWRNNTFCSVRCPPRSSYSPCANPCPPTCLTLSTSRDCPATVPCVEGCECEKGYILSGISCVPLSQCGCIDQGGSYHPVGEKWYTEKTCTTSCTCLVHNNITCGQTACQVSQECQSQDGLFLCQTSGMGVCHFSESSYYVGFDGTGHAFNSTCTYTLVKVCHPNVNLPFFKISANNKKKLKDNAITFYLHEVYIDIFEFHIILKKKHQVLINDKPVSLPVTTLVPGINITAKSLYTIVRIQDQVELKFDGRHFLTIRLSKACSGKVCGVCGNFNGEKEDEFTMPSDEPALDEEEFMDSWEDEDIDPNCQKIKDNQRIEMEVEEFVNGQCTQADVERAQDHCEAALQGFAWAHCTLQVVPKPFVLDCVNSFCKFKDLPSALCEFLQAFGAACGKQGLTPPHWRNSTFCPLECPAHAQYTNCVPSCLPSCSDPDGRCKGISGKVPSVCVEGCICQDDYVLNKNKCVPRSQCGCVDQDGFISAGKTWISNDCAKICTCTGGTIQCKNFHCPSGYQCQQSDNRWSKCILEKPWVKVTEDCTVFGDPYYRTFDSVTYRFFGQMNYILVKTVDMLPEGMVHLVVEGRNKMNRKGRPVLREVTIFVYDYKIQLQEDLRLLVNNERMEIPYNPSGQLLRVILRSQQLILITDFELVVKFNGKDNVVISLPGIYRGMVRGLCGNYDDNHKNEYMLPNGELTSDYNVFGKSWEVKPNKVILRYPRAIQEEEEEQEEQEEKESGFLPSECSLEQLARIKGTQACSVLVDPQGPFADCHQIVAPEPFQDHCISDVCTSQDPKETEELRCRVLSGYAIICQEAGADLAGWRNQTHCDMACPANTVYNSCMTPCPTSCAKPVTPKDCEGPCVEGCANLPGYAYSGIQSLPVANCGCTTNGVYHKLGDSFVTEDCSQHCTCVSSGILLCEPFGCRAGEICTLGNFTRGCFRESPCLQNPCHNEGRCQEQGTSFTCQCEFGYGGELCTEPRAVKLRRKPETSSFVAILLGMLVPIVLVAPILVPKGYVYIMWRRREKMLSQNPDCLEDSDTAPEPDSKATEL